MPATSDHPPPPAKKIKSRLIENAKVKKAFYRGAGSSSSGAPPLISEAEQVVTRDEGRFAPEDPVAKAALADVDEPLRVREQKRARGTAAGESAGPSTSAEGSRGSEGEAPGKRRRVERPKFAPPPPRSKGKQREERPAAAAPAISDKPQRTREQAEQERRQREKKAAKTNRRGQPDLGARMELLLEKIKR